MAAPAPGLPEGVHGLPSSEPGRNPHGDVAAVNKVALGAAPSPKGSNSTALLRRPSMGGVARPRGHRYGHTAVARKGRYAMPEWATRVAVLHQFASLPVRFAPASQTQACLRRLPRQGSRCSAQRALRRMRIDHREGAARCKSRMLRGGDSSNPRLPETKHPGVRFAAVSETVERYLSPGCDLAMPRRTRWRLTTQGRSRRHSQQPWRVQRACQSGSTQERRARRRSTHPATGQVYSVACAHRLSEGLIQRGRNVYPARSNSQPA